MLNLFIGVITNSMAEAKDEMYARKKEQARMAVEQRLKAKDKRKADKDAGKLTSQDEDGRIQTSNPIYTE